MAMSLRTKEYFIREAEPKHLLYDNKVKLLETYEVELLNTDG